MKFTASTKALAAVASRVAKAVPGQRDLPIFNGMLIESGDGILSLTCSDGSALTVTMTVEATIKDPGKVLVSARMFSEILSKLSDSTIAVTVSDDTITLESGRASFDLRSLPVDEFPLTPAPADNIVRIDGAELVAGLRQVAAAKSTDDARPVLTTAVIETSDGKVRFVATDSYRLAYRTSAAVAELDGRVLIPAPAVDWIARLAETDDLTLHLGEHRLDVITPTARLSASLIQGDYPPWERLLPDHCTATFETDTAALIEATKRINLLVNGVGPVKFSFSEGQPVTVTGSASGIGEGTEDVDGNYTGPDLVVAFNGSYLIAGLEACGSERVTLNLTDPLKPAVLHPVDDPTGFGYLLMPVRV